jgi:hypothetical protein
MNELQVDSWPWDIAWPLGAPGRPGAVSHNVLQRNR